MKRRDFIKTPALSLLLPATGGAERLLDGAWGDQKSAPPQAAEQGAEQRMHPDFITYAPGIEYFHLGNGDIQGVIQYSPREEKQSFLGLTIMDPENFCRKWTTFLYHPERGFANTRLGVTLGEEGHSDAAKAGIYAGVKGFLVSRENFRSIQWHTDDSVPLVALAWAAGECMVREEFFVPHEGAVLFRRVHVTNGADRPLTVNLSLSLYANFGLFTDIRTNERDRAAEAHGLASMKLVTVERQSTVYGRYDVRADLGTVAPGTGAGCTYAYAIKGGETLLRKKTFGGIRAGTAAYWKKKSTVETGNDILDRLYATSRTGLRSVISRSGRMDAGTWMYNMEWLGDHALAAEALLRAGFHADARLLIEKNLRDSIGPDGRTIESGRWFGYEYTEINQNGMMLFAVWQYLCWTGDRALLRKYWPKILLCGDFPLRKEFLDAGTHLVRNKREFWERSDSYGIEEGYELAYQFWVAFGLDKGAQVARALGEEATADRWAAASAAMREAMFGSSAFRMIEDGHLIKRRTRAGAWQKTAIPPKRSSLPPGAPIAVEESPLLEPDTIVVLPILYEMIDPVSPLAKETLRRVDALWNQRWEGGGYPRYNVTSEDNPPAPWPLSSMLVARASAAAGEDDRVWRVLEWLHAVAGESGSWFERYGQSITPPMPPVGIVGWTWYEIINLCSHHIAGFRPEIDRLVIRPKPITGIATIRSTVTIRGAEVELIVKTGTSTPGATVNGKAVLTKAGSIELPYPKKGSTTHITVNL
jgi:hypothetical protein